VESDSHCCFGLGVCSSVTEVKDVLRAIANIKVKIIQINDGPFGRKTEFTTGRPRN
jgi:hypothetical protein